MCEKKKLKQKTPYIKLQFIIMRHNENEIEKISQLAKQLEVDELVFKTVGIMDYFSKEDIKKYIPTNNNYSRYSIDSSNVLSKTQSKTGCDFIWNELVVNWDGGVVPCCFDMNNRHVFGNVFDNPVKSVWDSSKYTQFRRNILKNKALIPLCKNCPGTNKETFVKV
jgi:radical SAM protein with 4Fe4S-binding SPASM domain